MTTQVLGEIGRSTQVFEDLCHEVNGGRHTTPLVVWFTKKDRIEVVLRNDGRLHQVLQEAQQRALPVVVRLKTVVATPLLPRAADFEEEPERRGVKAPGQPRAVR